MISFELDKSNYEEPKELSIIDISNRHKLDLLSDDVKKLIYFFNEEYSWDDMFNFDDVQSRVSKGHYLFILYYGHKAIGYVFYEPRENDEFYLYNLYVTNCYERPAYSPVWFVNNTIKLLPKTFKKVLCECENWHTSAHNIFKSNGFIQI